MQHLKKIIGYLVTGSLTLVISTSYALTPNTQVCFTPGNDCTGLLVQQINTAQHSILVQAYSFTSMPIADALVAAEQRRVEVKVILDKSQVKDRHSVYGYLLSENIPVWIDYRVPIAHSKVMIIDDAEVEAGSFNYSKNALKNSENMLIIHDVTLANQYTKNWYKRLAVSEKNIKFMRLKIVDTNVLTMLIKAPGNA